MKRLHTLLVGLLILTATATAQPGTAMTFVGKASFYVTMGGQKAGETLSPSDTLVYAGDAFVMPAMNYGSMVIPSFTISGTTFTGGYAGVTWQDQTFKAQATDATGATKDINGSSLKGTLSHDGGIYKLTLEVTFTYGNMQFPITYSIQSYYVKDYTGWNSVLVGTQFGPYESTSSLTHRIRTYVEDGQTLMDVEIPRHQYPGTIMGHLTLGTCLIQGLIYNKETGTYSKDYSTDGLTMHFKAVTPDGTVIYDQDFPLSSVGNENITVSIANGKALIKNNYKLGNMPYVCHATMDQNYVPTAIEQTPAPVATDNHYYNLQGQRVAEGTRGILIHQGKKIVVE